MRTTNKIINFQQKKMEMKSNNYEEKTKHLEKSASKFE